MDRFPLDRFSADPPQPPTFSSPQPQPLPPPSQSSLRSSDEPDPFKISFLKGPSANASQRSVYLWSGCCRADPLPHTSNRLATLVTRASGDATALVSSYYFLAILSILMYFKRLAVTGMHLSLDVPSLGFMIFLIIRCIRQLFCRQRLYLHRCFRPTCSRTCRVKHRQALAAWA